MKTSKVSVALKDSGLVDLKGLQLQRTKTDYQVIDTFTLPKNLNFEHQYASLYYQRLTQLKKASCLTAKKLWPDCPPFLESLLHIQEGVYCCVAGTLYRETLLKANTIDEFIAERALVVQPKRDKYISKGDVIYLEDESGRIALSGSLPYDSALTGIVIIVCGKEVNQSFEVEKYTFPGMAEQVKPPLNRLAGSEKKVCLISGIEMEANYRHNNSLQLLIDYLLGFLGDEKQQKESSKIARLIVAGNLLSRTATVEAAKIVQSSVRDAL
jgi:DNA polymerase delta subunit 2